MAHPIQAQVPGAATALSRMDANSTALQARAPAGAAAQLDAHLDQLRRQAGPQLCAGLPPWYRPGPVGGAQHQPPWPGRAANYMIPMAAHPSRIPDIHTEQDGVNDFLVRADSAFGGSQAARSDAVTGRPPVERHRYGPRIYPQQVSTRNSADRQAAFPNHLVGNVRWFGAGPGARPHMRLAEYSGTLSELRGQVALTPGTLVTIASLEPQGPATGPPSVWQRFQATLPAGAPPVPMQQNLSFWHAAGLFVQSHQHYPRRIPAADLPAGTPPHQGWAFNGRFRCAFVYDSCYINETPGAAPASTAIAATGRSRLGQHRMLSMVQRALYSPDGLSPPNGARMAWLRGAGIVRIGGGGNIGGVDECQRMTCIWMLQVAELSRALGRAIFDLRHFASPQTEADFLRAEAEWTAFFVDYTELRP